MTYKEKRAAINRTNALKSTGPGTPAGKERSSMNACKHSLTGFHIVLQPDEMEAYNQLTAAILNDLDPRTEMEHQTVQKIIDAHFRLNRLSGLENNIFQFGAVDHAADSPGEEDRVAVMRAQTHAWLDRGGSFDILGRYESRLARQLLKFTQELERLQTNRRWLETGEDAHEPFDDEDSDDLASFGNNSPEIVMSAVQTEASSPSVAE